MSTKQPNYGIVLSFGSQLVIITNSFLHCDLYLSSGEVTRGQVRSNDVCAYNLLHNQDKASKMASMMSKRNEE